jgi:hypothetical protein
VTIFMTTMPQPPAGFDPEAEFDNVTPETFTAVPRSSHRRGEYELESILALGLLTLYLSNKKGWKVPSPDELATKYTEGADRIRTANRVLEKAGFMVRYRTQGDGGRWKTHVRVATDPAALEPIRAWAAELKTAQETKSAARKAAGIVGGGRRATEAAAAAGITTPETFPQVGPDGPDRDSVHRDPEDRDSVQGYLKDQENREGDQEETKPLPPTPAVPVAAPAVDEAKTGGEPSPTTNTPTADSLGALVASLVEVATWWKPADTRSTLEQLLARGLPPAEIARVAAEYAAGVHGHTHKPGRMLVHWPAAPKPASTEPEWARPPVSYLAPGTERCRNHRGEPAQACGKCKAERFTTEDDERLANTPRMTAAEAIAAARAIPSAGTTRSRQRRHEPLPAPTGPAPAPVGSLLGQVAATMNRASA